MKKGWLLLTLVAAFIAFGFIGNEAMAQGAVAGTVIDADGNPVEGAIVTIVSAVRQRGERPFHERFVTGENGVFGWRNVPAGRYFIHAAARRLGNVRDLIGVRDDEVTRVPLQLQGRGNRGGDDEEREFGSVVGQVINADGDPVEGAVVMLVPEGRRGNRRNPRHRGIRVRTNEEGIFEFERVPVGNYVIMAAARGEGRARDQIEVLADQATRVRIQLPGPR